MGIRTMMAAKTIAESLDYNITNLAMQKLLYLSHMFHMGKTGEALIDGHFEAWDLGPVEPSLYHMLKIFGNKPILGVFYEYQSFPEESMEKKNIDYILSSLEGKSAWQLVQITHQSHGAWAKNFSPDIQGMVISNSDIMEEYKARFISPDEHVEA